MARSLVALDDGFKYQAWLFWIHASRLLLPNTKVVEVGFEHPEVKAFDDVVIHYDPAHVGSWGDPINFAHYQAKYHVKRNGSFTAESLTDPAFIDASTATILGNLGNAYRRLGEQFARREFWLVSPWSIDPHDKLLAELWRDNTCALDLEVLRQGTRRDSKWVTLREHWCDVVGVTTDEELLAVVSRLRIAQGLSGLNHGFAEYVSAQLVAAGLKPLNLSLAAEPYSQIPWRLLGKGKGNYTKEDIQQIADENDLWGKPPETLRGRRIGIRTRAEWGVDMETRAVAVLPLEARFHGRFLRSEWTWRDVYERVRSFLREHVSRDTTLMLDLGAVTTLAFAAGYAAPEKDGLPVSPIQRRRGGEDIWDPLVPDPKPGGWAKCHDEPGPGKGKDLALGLSVAQDVWPAMSEFAIHSLPNVGRIVELQPVGGVGGGSVVSPAHGLHLALEAQKFIREARNDGYSGTVRLFIAGPNGLTFFLGQQHERLGRCQLYEFGLSDEHNHSYKASLLVPDDTRSAAPGS